MTTLTCEGSQRATYVEPEEYCRLAVSRRQLERHDDCHRSLRGLRDPDSQMVYYVDETILLGEERRQTPCRPR
jgi:hypothetical protein